MKFKDIIFEADYWTKFESEAKKLEDEMRDTYNRDDIHVNIIQHSNGDKAMGKVQIKTRERTQKCRIQKYEKLFICKRV